MDKNDLPFYLLGRYPFIEDYAKALRVPFEAFSACTDDVSRVHAHAGTADEPMSARRGVVKLTVVAAALAGAATAVAQGSIVTQPHVQGNVHLLTGPRQCRRDRRRRRARRRHGRDASRESLLAAVRELSVWADSSIVNTSADLDDTGGNEVISQAGMTVNGNPAATISHENVLLA